MPDLSGDRYLSVRLMEPRDAYWRIYSLDTDPEDIARQFCARYGQAPAKIIECAGAWWAGPVPERRE